MRVALPIICLALAACGGTASGGGATQSPEHTVLVRAVPGGEVAVQRSGATGHRVSTTVADTSALIVLHGPDYETAQALPSTAVDGAWAIDAASGDQLLIRIVLADGAVIETAPGDFR